MYTTSSVYIQCKTYVSSQNDFRLTHLVHVRSLNRHARLESSFGETAIHGAENLKVIKKNTNECVHKHLTKLTSSLDIDVQ